MNRDRMEELAALDALGALDGDDIAAWRALGDQDEAALRLRDDLAGAAATLCLLSPPAMAPDDLRQRVMEKLFVAGDAVIKEAPRLSVRAAWAAAAAVALLALAGATAATRQSESVLVRDTRTNPQNLHVPLEGYGEYAGVKAGVLWDSGQRGWYVQAAGLPVLPQTHRYRVWAVDAGGAVHDCGELPLKPGGLGRRFVRPGDAIDSMRGFAVSVESAGSHPAAPTTPAILISAGLKS